ncbi:MAG: cytochrome c oxidase subunit 3 [Thermoflexibacter sp.]|jgi:cytochrome c oxidase subunit 3|nr:cytochrome c oxidase subunit 3 [Thermoflexibacter sp.]
MTEITQKIIEEPNNTLSMHPKKFALWLFIVSIVMIFAGLTSAYLVKQAEGNWLLFDLPIIFYISSGVILLSSITMHWAYLSAKKDNFNTTKIAMSVTVVLGFAFLVTQIMGWNDLVNMGVFFAGSQSNPAGSFLYVFSGLHGLHLVSGIVFLLIILVAVFKYQIHGKNMVRMEMCATYWHFLDLLWIYLFVFLIVNS